MTYYTTGEKSRCVNEELAQRLFSFRPAPCAGPPPCPWLRPVHTHGDSRWGARGGSRYWLHTMASSGGSPRRRLSAPCCSCRRAPPGATVPSDTCRRACGWRTNLPNAHKMADSVICLPMHHALSDGDIQRTLECIVK